MKKTLSALLAYIFPIVLLAQVPKTVVVEHFTNTRCSICASRNPGFYNNLENHPDIIHIAYHPSSPYSTCVLNNHNVSENDDRTKYYNIYGSTPKFTIQGDNIPSSQNVSNPSLFTPYTGQTSPMSISMTHEKFGSDSMQVRVVIKTEATHSLSNSRLFVALVEDTIAYVAPNGENFHYDVFRKALTNIEGDALTLPANVGDSLIFEFSSGNNIDWIFKRMYALAILQDGGTKEVIQSSKTNSEPTGSPVGIAESILENIGISPNPAQDVLNIKSEVSIDKVTFYSLTGNVALEYFPRGDRSIQIGIDNLNRGVYFLQIQSGSSLTTKKVILK